jgi:hypothetical protein
LSRGFPNELGSNDGEVLEQALGDDACLNEDVIGAHLALDVVAVVGRLAMKMLIAIAVAQRGHVHHPEMIGECADQAGGLLPTTTACWAPGTVGILLWWKIGLPWSVRAVAWIKALILTVVQIGFRECCDMDADTTITKSPHLVAKSHTPFKNIFQRSDRKQKFRMESIDVVRC